MSDQATPQDVARTLSDEAPLAASHPGAYLVRLGGTPRGPRRRAAGEARVRWRPLEDRRRGFHFRMVHDAVGLFTTRCGIEDHSGRLQPRPPGTETTCAACLAAQAHDLSPTP